MIQSGWPSGVRTSCSGRVAARKSLSQVDACDTGVVAGPRELDLGVLAEVRHVLPVGSERQADLDLDEIEAPQVAEDARSQSDPWSQSARADPAR